MELKRWLSRWSICQPNTITYIWIPALKWKKLSLGAGEMSARLRSLGTSSKDKNLVPRTHIGQLKVTSPRESNTIFAFQECPNICVHTNTHTHTYTNKVFFFFFFIYRKLGIVVHAYNPSVGRLRLDNLRGSVASQSNQSELQLQWQPCLKNKIKA